jgi:hypothetical protein
MNYNIKQSFKHTDLQVGDLMYDALNDVMVRVAYIGSVVRQKVKELKISGMLDISSKTTEVEIRQYVFEDMEDKIIFMINVIGKDGLLPQLENGKPRFRHLMRSIEPTIIWPSNPLPLQPQPNPIYPAYPSTPTYPDPNYPYWTWCSDKSDSSDLTGTVTTQGMVQMDIFGGGLDLNTNISIDNLSQLDAKN